jgi:hypothetical protein
MAVAVVVVMTMAPEAAVDMPVTVVMVMAVPVTGVVVTGVVVTAAGVVAAGVTTTTMVAAAVVTATVAAVRTCIGSGRDERREADNGGRDESEECRTFEHCQRPFGSM